MEVADNRESTGVSRGPVFGMTPEPGSDYRRISPPWYVR
jgi:hypothetical protein